MNDLGKSPAPSGVLLAVGLSALAIYFIAGLLFIPLPSVGLDGEVFRHFVSSTFNYASSAFDLSVISPVQGLGGLAQPFAVWLNPGYIIPHLVSWGDPRILSYLVVIPLFVGGTLVFGRAIGLPWYLTLLGAQITAIFSFPPMFDWSQRITHLNLASLYVHADPCFAVPVALGTLLLAVFSCLGRLSFGKNVTCVALLPVLTVLTIFCSPLYAAMFLIPVGVFLAGIYLGSDAKRVFLWRTTGAGFCLIVCLLLNLHNFYRALFGYAARAVFPNELYVEVQQWDYLTNLIFQGGLATPFSILVMLTCGIACIYGTRQARGFAASVLAFQLTTIAISLVYVYSGIRWNWPLPSYLEYSALPAYVIAGLLGVWIGRKRWASTGRAAFISRMTEGNGINLLLVYTSILILPVLGLTMVIREASRAEAQQKPLFPNATVAPRSKPGGVIRHLEQELALTEDGRFRGAVASVLAVPGGGFLSRRGIIGRVPFSKEHIYLLLEYFRSFDPHFYMVGLWDLNIPTLEDNCHMVTPPFHFLVSRALSRPQDFHSRNFALITKANPKLMAALGARFLLTDNPQKDATLALRVQQTNADGVTVYGYEIQGANLGDLSPTETVLSTNASDTLSLMTSSGFSFRDTAVVHEAPLRDLTRADSGAIYFEKGGVRIRGSSHGPALLVLPLQFSNSLTIISQEANSHASPVRLLRVNLVQTGVLFNGPIDIKIAHVFGPLRNIAGRFGDIEDCRRLGIRENGEIPYPANYQPLAWSRQGSLEVGYQKNFHGLEEDATTGSTWNWAAGDSEMSIQSSFDSAVKSSIRFTLSSFTARTVDIQIGDTRHTVRFDRAGSQTVQLPEVRLVPGLNKLSFTTDRPAPPPIGGDPRPMAFGVHDFAVSEGHK